MPICPDTNRNKFRVCVLLFASALLAACTGQRTVPESSPQAAIPSAASRAFAPESAAAPKSPSWSVDGYKKDAATWISSMNGKQLFEGAPPPVLKSIVVLSIVIDAEGQPRRVAVLRSNGYTELEQAALQSVHHAAPLPRPSRLLLRHGGVEYTETWLFRDDGRFQIRSIALPQAAG